MRCLEGVDTNIEERFPAEVGVFGGVDTNLEERFPAEVEVFEGGVYKH